MKALSVKQPYADLIYTGLKTLEIRSRPTNYRGDLLICSSKKLQMIGDVIIKNETVELGFWWWVHGSRRHHYGQRKIDPFGQAFCIVTLAGCRPFTKADEPHACIPFVAGHYAWELTNLRIINPFPVKGQLGIYNVDFDLFTLPPSEE